MAGFADRFRQFRFVRKHSSPLQKLTLLIAILFSSVALVTLGVFIHKEQAKAEALREQAKLEQQENQDLNDKLSNLGTMESVEQIAREILGLINANGIFFQPEG